VTGVPPWTDALFAIGIIVAMVPEGLLPTLTLALVLATQRMARRSVLIRYLPAVETLGATTVICTDKTGTLTLNRMHVRETFLPDEGTWRDAPPDPARASHFLRCAAHCHDLKATSAGPHPQRLGDPTELALVELAERVLGVLPVAARVDELPFDNGRMRMTVVTEDAGGRIAWCKGAPEAVLPRCAHVAADGALRAFEASDRDAALAAAGRQAAAGQRVVAFAWKTADPAGPRAALEETLVFAGLVALEDPSRPEVPEALARCRAAGIRVIMVTGDHPRTALAVARRIGLVHGTDPLVLSGETLRQLSDAELGVALDASEVVCARVGPEQKMRIVETLKRKRHVVAVTGDGVNDAPALKAAHIGIAMGRGGTDVAREAADMVLLDDDFASIVAAIEEGRAVFDNIRKFLTYILAHNVPELVPYLAFALTGIPLPLTPLQILCVDMGGDTLTALGLGVERAEPEVMLRPPCGVDERLFDGRLALRAYLFLGAFEAVAAMSAYFFVLHSGGWHYGQALAATDPLYLRATTACLGAIVLLQIVNVFLCRSTTRSIAVTGLRGNALIAWGGWPWKCS
jgi:calcium-translocating P-type ATPase